MKTLKQMRIEKLIAECDKQLQTLHGEIDNLMYCTINGQYNPKVAIRIYREKMARVEILSHRSWNLTNKEQDYDRNYSVINFKDFIQFFEL
jgi:hypothetical protein